MEASPRAPSSTTGQTEAIRAGGTRVRVSGAGFGCMLWRPHPWCHASGNRIIDAMAALRTRPWTSVILVDDASDIAAIKCQRHDRVRIASARLPVIAHLSPRRRTRGRQSNDRCRSTNMMIHRLIADDNSRSCEHRLDSVVSPIRHARSRTLSFWQERDINHLSPRVRSCIDRKLQLRICTDATNSSASV